MFIWISGIALFIPRTKYGSISGEYLAFNFTHIIWKK